jgi:hypothetical protein
MQRSHVAENPPAMLKPKIVRPDTPFLKIPD